MRGIQMVFISKTLKYSTCYPIIELYLKGFYDRGQGGNNYLYTMPKMMVFL